MRKVALAENEYYHIFNRSIAGFKIFNTDYDFRRFVELLLFYNIPDIGMSYSFFNRLNQTAKNAMLGAKGDSYVDIICYCIMPTHFHLVLKQLVENGITKYMSLLENSYSRYFNISHKRKGPLWESRFKNVRISTDEQLLHLTRYVHLNPTSAALVDDPLKWDYSSYQEFVSDKSKLKICNYNGIISLDHKEYRKFVNDRKDYQRDLSLIKSYLIDSYTG